MPQAIHTQNQYVLARWLCLRLICASSSFFSLSRYRLLTMQATRDKPMINIAKVSDWLTRNANEKLYPRLL
jgi:hypothetical protein